MLFGMLPDAERFRLLHGPTAAPPLKRGDKAHCHFRDAEVVVTGWSDGPIPWLRCRVPGSRGGGSGLLVDEELARVVRHESAVAIMHWWRCSMTAVCHWRKALGVGRTDNEGSRRLIRAAAWAGGAVVRYRGISDRECDVPRERALALNLARHLRTGYHGPWWTAEQLALLGTLPDAEVARQVGRSENAVRQRRCLLGIPNPHDRRRGRSR